MQGPTRYKIAEYWATDRDRCQRWKALMPLVDLGEPACFACGFHLESWDVAKTPQQRWNRSGLQRAHIVARSQGGSDDLDNIVLLCAPCHRKMPMTTDPEVALRWFKDRVSEVERFGHEEAVELQQELTRHSIEIEHLDSEQLRKFRQYLVEQRYTKRYGLHGNSASAATRAQMLADFLRSLGLPQPVGHDLSDPAAQSPATGRR